MNASKKLESESSQGIPILLEIIQKYLDHQILLPTYKNDTYTKHYLMEIIRYKNKIQFILNKTLRSMKIDKTQRIIHENLLFYAVYAFFWEKKSWDKIKNESFPLSLKKDQIHLFKQFYERLSNFKWEYALKGKTKIEKLSIQDAIPTFFIQKLLPVMNLNEIQSNSEKMDVQARIGNFTIRLQSEDELIDFENKFRHLNFIKDEDIPKTIHIPLKHKAKIIASKFYQENKFIIQDKSSIASVYLMNPQENEKICDLCAAPGMKTRLIAQISKNRANIVAVDFNLTRLKQIRPMMQKIPSENYHLIHGDGIHPPIREIDGVQFDKILLDAPCTGSGTFSTHPELKWRQNLKFLNQNVFLQEKLIERAYYILKPGGILLYSTCSFYPEEGELHINKILDKFEIEKLPSWISPCYKINNSSLLGAGRFFPTIHNTNGFFIAKLKKKSNNYIY
ncbi:RsmB/NOP family class I SAM-dependent RNA methyltransferase [Promethearchaeum syntrophicum]|uniref:RsmB/NOP family class I SAM-dependent RNA methyltransferase n=1 Tax=Promethearchaeum syntrophicum TaxID=2594042 RepID=A0A5B9DCL8_9ARCH|nr:RsmB/NOP family class I SAM-dependent RNA methyltransferase [Candidatus Prometheoarchaeum syntrophicum]QEE16500.1 tRNA (cytosine(48)-C(5))-methyltransferase [Candidatus Prometheoarchaeum syntrophicum]